MRSRKFVVVAALTLMIGMMPLGGGSVLAAGATRWVNANATALTPPGTSCDHPGYKKIQDAVDASASGDRINVCPGTYAEQVTVPAGKNNITLRSTQPLAAVIKAPPVMVDPGDIVHVNSAQDVTIREFTISGPLPDAEFCSPLPRTGVRVDGNGSATILRNHITEIRSANPALRGCQNGVAILVGRQVEGQVGSATITENLIDKYQKNGPTVSNTGSRATITGNIIVGIGPTPVIAQNGIQVSDGAIAEVRFNRVSDNAYSLANLGGDSATGILLYAAGSGTIVAQNEVVKNDDNIDLFMTSGAKISQNRALDSIVYDGIYLAADSMNNRITENFLRRNKEHDCHDDSVGAGTAGTANFWINDDGVTQNKPGLCRPHGDDQHDGDDHHEDNDKHDNDKRGDHKHSKAD